MYFKMSQRKLQADTGLGSNGEGNQEQSQTSSENIGEEANVDLNAENKQNNNQKTFTQEDIDRIVSKRLDQAQKKWDKETQTRFEELKMASMSPEQKQEYEKSKLDQQLSEKEKQLQTREFKLDAIDKLQKRGLEKELADILDYSNEESIDNSIELLEKTIQKSVQSIVNDRLRGKSVPKSRTEGNRGGDAFLTGLRNSK